MRKASSALVRRGAPNSSVRRYWMGDSRGLMPTFGVVKTNHDTPINPTDPGTLFPFDDYLKGRGLTRITGYRYRKQGLLKTVNIFGRLYIERDEVARFEARAIAGDFHREAKTPSRRELAAA